MNGVSSHTPPPQDQDPPSPPPPTQIQYFPTQSALDAALALHGRAGSPTALNYLIQLGFEHDESVRALGVVGPNAPVDAAANWIRVEHARAEEGRDADESADEEEEGGDFVLYPDGGMDKDKGDGCR